MGLCFFNDFNDFTAALTCHFKTTFEQLIRICFKSVVNFDRCCSIIENFDCLLIYSLILKTLIHRLLTICWTKCKSWAVINIHINWTTCEWAKKTCVIALNCNKKKKLHTHGNLNYTVIPVDQPSVFHLHH